MMKTPRPEPLIRLALEKVADGKPVEALHLTDVVLSSDPKNPGALSRIGHSATLLPDGTVLVAGGGSWSPLSSAELYK
jgi:galactose oxidase-like protein